MMPFKREFRALVIEMVLATDTSRHFQQVKAVENALQQPEGIDKRKALSLLLHVAAISHPARAWDLHHRQTMSLLEEFFRQGDKEAELGLPFPPLCDRKSAVVAQSQIEEEAKKEAAEGVHWGTDEMRTDEQDEKPAEAATAAKMENSKEPNPGEKKSTDSDENSPVNGTGQTGVTRHEASQGESAPRTDKGMDPHYATREEKQSPEC